MYSNTIKVRRCSFLLFFCHLQRNYSIQKYVTCSIFNFASISFLSTADEKLMRIRKCLKLLPYKPAVGDWIFLPVKAWLREGEILASVFGRFLHVFVSFEVDDDHADDHNCENSHSSNDTKYDKVNFIFCT